MPAVTADLIARVDDWLDIYTNLSAGDRCDFIDQTLDYPLTEDFLEDTEMSILIAELEDRAGPAAMVRLVEKLRHVLPEFHFQETSYVEDTMLAWGLFHDDPEQISTAAAYLRKDPVQFASPFLMTFRWLCLYQKRDFAAEQAKTGFSPIHTSPEISPGVANILADFLIYDKCERLYDQISSGESPDAASLSELEDQLYGDDAMDLEERVIPVLSSPTWPQPISEWRDKHQRSAALEDLRWVFLRYQRDTKKFPFTTSSFIWNSVLRFFEDGQSTQRDTYFYPTEQKLHQYLGSYTRFLSNQQDWAFTTVWGIPYVVDFLKTLGWMTPEEHAHCLSLAEHAKSLLIDGYAFDLWQYDFVHRWTPPDSVDPDGWAKEKQIFADSLTVIRNVDRPDHNELLDFVPEEVLSKRDPVFGAIHGLLSAKQRPTHPDPSKRKKPNKKRRKKKPHRH